MENYFNSKKNIHPAIALLAVVIVSIILVGISLAIFIKSDSYTTLKRIQTGLETSSNLDGSKYDTKSPIKSTDIENFNSKIQEQIKAIENSDDLNLNEANQTVYQ